MKLPNFKELITKKECIPVAHYTTKYIEGKWYASNGKKKYLIDNWEIEESSKPVTIYSRPDNKYHPTTDERLVNEITSKSLNAINGGWSKFYEGQRVNPRIIDAKTCTV